jgi:hypothetical protein
MTGTLTIGGLPSFIFGLYSPGSFTIQTESYVEMCNHLKLTSTQRLTLVGTSRLRIN